MDNRHDEKNRDVDDEGVIVAGPDARARARGEKKDDAAVRKSKRDGNDKPPRDTRDSPAENPKTAATGELPVRHNGRQDNSV